MSPAGSTALLSLRLRCRPIRDGGGNFPLSPPSQASQAVCFLFPWHPASAAVEWVYIVDGEACQHK
eukprot:9471094-Pyramimonas_sp.AAC.1